MAIELKMDVPGGEAKISGTNEKDIFRQAAFWQSLPTVCPIDGSPTRLEFRSPQDYEYYLVVSTGDFPYEYKLGIRNNQEQNLFTKGRWTYYDPNAEDDRGKKGVEITVWEYGKLIEKNLPENRGVKWSRPSPSTTSDPEGFESGGGPQAPEGNQAPREAPKRDPEEVKKAQKWVLKQFQKTEIPDQVRGSVLTAMMGRPFQNDINRYSYDDCVDIKRFLKDVPTGLTDAWNHAKEQDPDLASADGSDLDAPDFFPDDE